LLYQTVVRGHLIEARGLDKISTILYLSVRTDGRRDLHAA